MTDPIGLAIVDKPSGWTSHDVVAKARGVFGTRKVGHSGTLDPDATGVLLLGVGKVTRVLRFLDGAVKSYTGEVVLGVETDSLDSTGAVTATHDMAEATVADVREASLGLTGDVLQVPPMVSAVRIGGRRLHEIAREGGEVDRPARPVTVHRFEVGATPDPMVFRIEVDCSAGTYIRVLAADLGVALGGGAHLRALRRTAIGSFTIDEAQPLESAELLPPATAVRDLAPITVDEDTAVDVGYGRVLTAARIGAAGSGPYPLIDRAGDLLAVYEPHRAGTVKPAVVLVDPRSRRPDREATP